MLILTRKPGESIYIGDIKVTIVEIKGHQIRVGIDAPPEVRIYREEIYLQIMEENKMAAETAEGGLEGIAAALKSPGGAPRVGGVAKLKGASSGSGASGGEDDGSKKKLGIHLPEVPKRGSDRPAPSGTEPKKGSGPTNNGPEVFVKRRKKD